MAAMRDEEQGWKDGGRLGVMLETPDVGTLPRWE